MPSARELPEGQKTAKEARREDLRATSEIRFTWEWESEMQCRIALRNKEVRHQNLLEKGARWI